MHFDLEVEAPIIIGSIPLLSSSANVGQGDSEDKEQEPQNPVPETSQYPDLRKNTTYTYTWIPLFNELNSITVDALPLPGQPTAWAQALHILCDMYSS